MFQTIKFTFAWIIRLWPQTEQMELWRSGAKITVKSSCFYPIFRNQFETPKFFKFQMNVEAMHSEQDRYEPYSYHRNTNEKGYILKLESCRIFIVGFIAKRIEFYIYFHILARYHRRSKVDNRKYSNLFKKLLNLNHLSIADLYQIRNELSLYDIRWSNLPYFLYLWFKNVIKYYRHSEHASVTAVDQVRQLNTSCKIQEMCKVLLISSLIAPDDHNTLNLLVLNIRSQLITTKHHPDEAKCLLDACISELKHHPSVFEANANTVTENTLYEQEPTEINGRLNEDSIPLEKPNHMAILYSMQQDVSLQSLLASELLLKSSDQVPI